MGQIKSISIPELNVLIDKTQDHMKKKALRILKSEIKPYKAEDLDEEIVGQIIAFRVAGEEAALNMSVELNLDPTYKQSANLITALGEVVTLCFGDVVE